ncbi:uncharacterized protein [Diabrotica undecimpunctata]|uniref:uncharacterized protein n=1 Tax=Diabrotica undecimpunctata TaxID=50387 RepID=UPI003B638380
MDAGSPHKIRENMQGCFSVVAVLLHLVVQSNALRLTRMDAPPVADLRQNMTLDCHFDMGNEDLYAVKWYKDDQEFFRYMPRGQQKTLLFPVPGVQVRSSETDCSQVRCKITLSGLSRIHSSGAYRCEISSEAPAFRLASETHNVTVAAIPQANPKIDGLVKSYIEGDNFSVKCTSDYADPEPILTWKINGNDVSIPVKI